MVGKSVIKLGGNRSALELIRLMVINSLFDFCKRWRNKKR